jgi:hypothetical protein
MSVPILNHNVNITTNLAAAGRITYTKEILLAMRVHATIGIILNFNPDHIILDPRAIQA